LDFLGQDEVSFLFETNLTQDSVLFESYKKHASEFRGVVLFYWINSSFIHSELSVCHYGKKFRSFLNQDSNNIFEESRSFILNYSNPLISALDNSNFKRLASLGKLMFILVSDYSSDALMSVDQFKQIVYDLPMNYQELVIFGHINGVTWKKFLRKYNGRPNSIVVLDVLNDAFYHFENLSRESILETLKAIHMNDLELTEAVELSLFSRLSTKFSDYYPWSLLCALPLLLLILLYFMPLPKEKND
jgi:hypothetical protein